MKREEANKLKNEIENLRKERDRYKNALSSYRDVFKTVTEMFLRQLHRSFVSTKNESRTLHESFLAIIWQKIFLEIKRRPEICIILQLKVVML